MTLQKNKILSNTFTKRSARHRHQKETKEDLNKWEDVQCS